MKSLRLMLCAMPLMLTGCSTMSSVNWSAANPWNWFGSSTKVSEQGVGELTAIKARSAALMCWIAIFLLTPVLKSVHRLVTFTAKHLAIAKRPTVMIIVPSNVKPKAVNILATSSAGNGVALKG